LSGCLFNHGHNILDDWSNLGSDLLLSWSHLHNRSLLLLSWGILGSLSSSWNLNWLVITEGVGSPWVPGGVHALVVLAEALEGTEATLRLALSVSLGCLCRGSWVVSAEAL